MKAIVKYGFGKYETEIREVPVPEIGEDDVLLEVKAAGVCGSDIAFDNGGHENLLNPPVILGHEFSGSLPRKVRTLHNGRQAIASYRTIQAKYAESAMHAAQQTTFPARKDWGLGMVWTEGLQSMFVYQAKR